MFSRRVLIASLLALCAGATLSGPAAAQPPQVAAYPSPGTSYNSPTTTIAFRGIPASQIGSVRVVGSASGNHTGHIAADSDGNGGSFLADQGFRPGETVTVSTSLNIIGGSGGTFSFKIEHPGFPITRANFPIAPGGQGAVQHFRSRPDLLPPSVWVSHNSAPSSEGDIFVAPQNGPIQNGPMLLDSSGRLIWFQPYPVGQKNIVTDFRVQSLNNQPVLTWFQGYTNHGAGVGQGVIFNQNYQRIAIVNAGNGYNLDLHEFLLTNTGQAYLFAVSSVSLPGITRKPVFDAVVQEVDIKTGLVLFEWHALDHIPLSYSQFTTKSPGFVFDPYHANSIAVDRDNNLIVSMRDTSATYKIDRATGQIIWQLGGKHSSFRMGSGTSTAFQHDAVLQPDGSFTIFDDGAGPPLIHKYARGIRVALNSSRRTASLLNTYGHAPQVSTNFEGSVQELSGGDVFLGWGQQPYFSEDTGSGRQIFDAHFVAPTTSYRAYRFTWNAQPPTTPALAGGTAWRGAPYLWASWNGATDVAAWRVLAGKSSSSLTPIGSVRRNGFETGIPASTEAPDLQVQPLGASGQVLATSPVVTEPRHIEAFGSSAFVPPSSGFGGLPIGCFTGAPCRLTTTITSGRSVLARTGTERLAANSVGIVYFRLSGAARSKLGRAHRLGVQVTVTDTSHVQLSTPLTLVGFSTSGAGPARHLSSSPGLELMGATDFVNSSAGVGGILTACHAAVVPCKVSATVSAGRTVIARTGRETVGAGDLGYVFFTLTASGRSMLAHARGNQLGVQVQLSSGSSSASGQIALVGFR